MPERRENTNLTQEIAKNPYVGQFEERLSKLQPYPDARLMARKFGTDVIGLYPEKFTSAILWHRKQGFEILIGNSTKSGYRQMDHDKILDEYGINFDPNETLLSFLVTTGGNRFLLTNGLSYFKHAMYDKLVTTLKNYDISVAFSTEYKYSRQDKYALCPNENSSIAIGNYTEAIDKLLFDDWTRQIASTYGLTVNEWLWLRVTKKLPDGKKPLR